MRGQNQTKACCKGMSGKVTAAKQARIAQGLSLFTAKAPGA